MTSELWEALHGDEADEHELTTLVSHYFAGGRHLPGSDDVQLTKAAGSEAEAALILHFHDGVLADISPGPALTSDDVAELRARIERGALADDGIQVCRKSLFSMPRADGWWRYRDMFQLIPAPDEAPRPGMVLGEHPLIAEIAYPKSSDGLVRLVRERFRTWELVLLLNLMLYGDVSTMGERSRHVWVLSDESGHPAKYLSVGYWIPGMTVLMDEFTEPVWPAMGVLPEAEYNARRGIGTDETLDVPSSLTKQLDRYFAMSPEDRMRFLRAAYWLRHARDVWEVSHTAYYLAVITAIEVMLDSQGERCPTCKKMTLGKGATAAFVEFLDRHAPLGEDEPSRKELYRARGKLTHGGVFLRSDIPRSWGTLDVEECAERDRSGAAQRTAKMALLNWLAARPDS